MTTAQEIRARVARTDAARIEKRSEAAAAVFGLAQRCDGLRAELAQVQQQLSAAVAAAMAVMTPKELAQFIGRPGREVNQWAAATSARRGTRSPEADRRAAAGPGPADATVGDAGGPAGGVRPQASLVG